MSNERPYRLALLGTSPVSDGGSCMPQTKSLPCRSGGGVTRSVTEGAPWTF